jgi:hypothetical protein
MSIKIKCPNCRQSHDVDTDDYFSSFDESDRQSDVTNTEIDCNCGKKIEIQIDMDISVNMDLSDIKTTSSFDINSDFVLPDVIAPNQIKLFL